MKRSIKLILILLDVLTAASARTRIRDTLVLSNGDTFTGRMTISWPAFTSGSSTVIGGRLPVDVVRGAIDIYLEPTDTASPSGVAYTVSYSANGNPYTEYWNVPTSASPVTVRAIRTETVPTPNLSVSLGQISQSGASTGYVPQWSGTSWVAGALTALTNPMTTAGDLIYGGASGTPTRLGIGANNYVLTSNGSAPYWAAASGGGAVSSVFGRTGAVTATSGDYTTAQVTESGNLYFTNARAQSAMSGLYESPLTFSSPLSRSVNTIDIPAASGSVNGYLSSTDWTTFNGKQAALGFTPVTNARTVSTTSPLAGGGALSGDLTLTLSMWGSGTRPVAANALGTAGNCVQWTAAGLGDTGSACGSGGGGANSLGTYLVQTATNAPANAQVMASLGTGIVKNTTTTGVQSIAVLADIIALTGTGATAATNLSLATVAGSGSASDLGSGTLPAGRLPALTGDVTSSAGSSATTLANVPSGTPHAGSALYTAIAAPATPAAGKASVYVDSTSKNLAVKNDAGTVNHGVQTKASVSNNFLTAIADDGTVSAAQPSCSSLSGVAASCSTDTTSATNISSGSLADARLSANVALLASNQTVSGNRTYTGTTDASGAAHTLPAKTGAAASKPGTCTVGETYFANDATAGQNLYFCTASNTWTQQLNSGGGGSASWSTLADDGTSTGFPVNTFIEWDDFLWTTTSTGSIGKLGWNSSCTSGTVAPAAATTVAGHPGLYKLTTGTTSGNICQLALGSLGSGLDNFSDLSAIAGWEMVWIIKPVTSVDTNTTIRVGVLDANNGTSDLSRSSHMVELLSTNVNPGNWYLKSCNSTGTCNSIDTTVAASTTNWHKIRIWSDVAGTLKAAVSSNGGAYSSTVSVSTNFTGSTAPSIYIKTGTSASRDLYVDYWGMRINSLGR